MSKQSPIEVSQDTSIRKSPIGIDDSSSNSDNTILSTDNKSSKSIDNQGIVLFDPSSNSNPSSPNRTSINIQDDKNYTLSQLTSNTNTTNSSSSLSTNRISNSILFPELDDSEKKFQDCQIIYSIKKMIHYQNLKKTNYDQIIFVNMTLMML